jgi:hypothetical protein
MNKDNKENLVVPCCQCGGHLKRDEVKELKIEAIKYKFYICEPCLEKVPNLSAHIVKPLKKV